MATTKEQVKATIEVLLAIADAIRELGQVPSGHLYARLCGHMNVEQYQAFINSLVQAKVIEVRNHLIIWVGPPKGSVDLVSQGQIESSVKQ